jgi:hypothetical protein
MFQANIWTKNKGRPSPCSALDTRTTKPFLGVLGPCGKTLRVLFVHGSNGNYRQFPSAAPHYGLRYVALPLPGIFNDLEVVCLL